MMDIPEFLDREREIRELKAVLSGRPNVVYFVYGPINSGKTALLLKVFEELPENYRVFYVNFRERDVQSVKDLLRVLFRVKENGKKKIRDFLKELLKSGARVIEKLGGIPIPDRIFDLLFRNTDKAEDVFVFLREYFSILVEEGYRPVFVLDEMQTIKEILNATGKPVISGLFNFLVRLTKETHLCHCLCATSDCLFIEGIYSDAHLEGRAEYILVDDLSKEEAFEVYNGFGFENKELVWDYIGGKLGDMVRLFERKKRGYPEGEILQEMLKDEVEKLGWLKLSRLKKMKDGMALWEFLKKFQKGKALAKNEVEDDFDKLLFWIEENVLFYNPLDGLVRPQSRLLWRAIREVS